MERIIDGRTIEIIDKSKADPKAKALLQAFILERFEKSDLFKSFLTMTFVYEDINIELVKVGLQAPSAARVIYDEVINNKNIIHVYANSFQILVERQGVEETYAEFEHVLNHEVMHILQRDYGEAHKNYIKAKENLDLAISETSVEFVRKLKKKYGLPDRVIPSREVGRMLVQQYGEEKGDQLYENYRKELQLFFMRVALFNVVRNTFFEGIADFGAQFEQGKIIFSNTEFLALYERAKSQVEKFVEMLKSQLTEGDIDLLEWDKQLFLLPYAIGLHMVYSIIFLREAKLEEIMGLEPLKFIAVYEKAMLKKGMTPIFSLNSGKGLFDYNRAIQQWWIVIHSD